MNLLALMLLPTVMQPLPAVMPFYDVNKREQTQVQVWHLAINKFRSNDQWKEIRAVNNYWSNPTYTYGLMPFKWQTPEELFESHRGDCKDIAVAKYYSLRYLGIPASRLKFTVALDENNDLHAVLVVDNKVLDNRTRSIQDVEDVNYEPAYSVNEDNLWMLTNGK